jgi:hypothetical protein
MAHFAELDENNVVIRVLVIEQAEVDTGNWGDPSRWIKTSYNTRGGIYYTPSDPETPAVPDQDQSKAFRKNFAGMGSVYDANRDAFIPPKMYSSWVLDEASCLWVPPLPKPDDGMYEYEWDEATVSWKKGGKMPTSYAVTMESTIL